MIRYKSQTLIVMALFVLAMLVLGVRRQRWWRLLRVCRSHVPGLA